MNDPELQEFVGAHKPHDETEVLQSPAFKRANAFFDFVELATFTILAILLISCFFFRHTVVDGHSMDKTLSNGEHLIISDFMYTPKNGDIVVFEVPSDGNKSYIKRVIATAGQTVDIRAGVVYIDGVALVEDDYVYFDPYGLKKEDINYHVYADTPIPEGYIFVLGDHRNGSKDSRSIGLIDVRTVLGRVILRVTPLDSFGEIVDGNKR